MPVIGSFDGELCRRDQNQTMQDLAGEACAVFARKRGGQAAKVLIVNVDDAVALAEMPGVEIRVGPVQRGCIMAGRGST